MKNNKKRLLVLFAVLLAVCVTLCGLTACFGNDDTVYVTGIVKTATNDNGDVYTVYYSDGTTSTINVTNGKDGDDVTAEDVYQEYVKRYGEISYSDFLTLYLNFNVNDCSAINRCLQSVAKVYTEFTEYSSSFGYIGSTSKKTAVYCGSAVIYKINSDYTYFITNYHVVYDADAIGSKISENVHVYLYGSESSPVAKSTSAYTDYDYGDMAIYCEYVGGSVNYDIAVIKAKTSDVFSVNENVCEVEFADRYYVGETAIAIGNPEDMGLSVTKGIVSIDNDFINLDIDGTTRSYRSIRIDTSIYGGSSGGGLFNEEGKLIGITHAGDTTDENINYAVPLTIVKNSVENVMHYNLDGNDSTNGVYKITIGITVTQDNSKYVYDEKSGYGTIYEDVLISSVNEKSIASDLNLQSGDQITAIYINGERKEITRYYDIGDCLLMIFENNSIQFEFKRDGVVKTSSVYVVKSSDLSLN